MRAQPLALCRAGRVSRCGLRTEAAQCPTRWRSPSARRGAEIAQATAATMRMTRVRELEAELCVSEAELCISEAEVLVGTLQGNLHVASKHRSSVPPECVARSKGTGSMPVTLPARCGSTFSICRKPRWPSSRFSWARARARVRPRVRGRGGADRELRVRTRVYNGQD